MKTDERIKRTKKISTLELKKNRRTSGKKPQKRKKGERIAHFAPKMKKWCPYRGIRRTQFAQIRKRNGSRGGRGKTETVSKGGGEGGKEF